MTGTNKSRPSGVWRLAGMFIAAASLLLAVAACGSAGIATGDGSSASDAGRSGGRPSSAQPADRRGGHPSSTSGSRSPRLSGSVTVSAAASLTEAFDELKADFEAAHPGVTLTLNYGSSGRLANQITAGAPVDVAAFADTTPMDTLARSHLLVGPARVFAHNKLVIVTKPGNPEQIESLADLADVGTVAMCASSAPCGKYGEAVLGSAGVRIDASRITRGQDAKATLGAVAQGDADAGVVYVTDAAASNLVDSVDIPDRLNVTADYPIAVVADSGNRSAAESLVDYVLGAAGQAILVRHGFLPA